MKYKLTKQGYEYFHNAHLSKRELEVVSLLFECATNRDVAEKLFISEKAVKFHNTNIYKKLNCKCRHDLSIRYKHFFILEDQICKAKVSDVVVEAEKIAANVQALPFGEANFPQDY